MKETGKDVQLFFQAAQAVMELLLGFALNHKVRTRDQHLSRDLNGLSIGNHPVGRFVQAQ